MFYYCQTSVLYLYNGMIFSRYLSLLALYLSWTPSLKTGTSPPSCLHLHNRLYILCYYFGGQINSTFLTCTFDFFQVETELIDKLDILVSENKGDEEYKHLFNAM